MQYTSLCTMHAIDLCFTGTFRILHTVLSACCLPWQAGWAGKVSSHCCWINHMHRNSTIITCCLCDATTWLCSFLIKTVNSLLCGTTHIIAVDRSSAHMCWQMASNSQYTLPPQSSLQESASSKSQLHSRQRSKGPSPESFLTIGGCFECYTYRITTPGRLKKKERKKKINNYDFRPFQVCHCKIVKTYCYILLQTGAGFISHSM